MSTTYSITNRISYIFVRNATLIRYFDGTKIVTLLTTTIRTLLKRRLAGIISIFLRNV